MTSLRLLPALLLALAFGRAGAESFPPVRATKGMVAADNATASAVGAQMLVQGGDAVDAAVATALMLGVLQPFASGIGGGGFAVVRRADGTALALDFREVAPAGASRDMYLDKKGEVIPKASTRGPRAAGVPGEVAGLFELHRRYGKLPWKKVVAPAVKAATDGFPAGELLHRRVTAARAELAANPALAKDFLTADGKPIPIGGTVRRPALGRTLTAISERGAAGFYEGKVAHAIGDAMKKDGGLITAADLAAYRAKERPLVQGDAFGYHILSMPPPSSGGAVLLQVLRVLDGTDLKALGHNSSPYLHRLTEALKHAFADRAEVMGDPDFTPVPLDALIGDATVARVRAAFDPHTTLPRSAYGGKYGLPEDGGTSHLCTLDAEGNAVAMTSTVNTSFGSMYVAGDTGVLLNDQMDDFVAKPGVPNAFGLVGREANTIRPGKRPLSSMTPTIVLRDGKVVLVVGASGGPTIITGTLQVLLNVLVFGMDVRSAVEAPRVHHQWVPEVLMVEPTLATDVRDGLRRRGHTIYVAGRFTAVQAIVNGPKGMSAASDPSKLGRPAGVDEIGGR
ncbi:MAG: gamma-glutamyltransferase [Myxococcales bacterium]|nr:gamma-glutamyltransferase [Myxococcales bacterium]